MALAAVLITGQSRGELSFNFGLAPNSENPASDSNGSNLLAVAQAAGAELGRYFETDDLRTVELRYVENLGYGAITSNSASNPLRSSMSINADLSYYFDPTPLLDEEFSLTPTFYGDLNSTDRTHFTGSPSHDLEVAYRGNAVRGTAARGAYDLFSILSHELLHTFAFRTDLTSSELADDDFDTVTDHDLNVALLADNQTHPSYAGLLMGGSAIAGVRETPSLPELSAASRLSSYRLTGFPRYYFEGGDMNDEDDWQGNSLPPAGSRAVLLGTGYATGPLFFRSLKVLDGRTQTRAQTITVAESLELGTDESTDEVFAWVEAGGTLEAAAVINNGQTLSVYADGTLHFDHLLNRNGDSLDGRLTASGGSIVGGEIVNEALIRTYGTDTVTFNLQLHDFGGGSEGQGMLQIRNTRTRVFGPQSSPNYGMIIIEEDNELEFDYTQRFAGTVELEEDAGLIGPKFKFEGDGARLISDGGRSSGTAIFGQGTSASGAHRFEGPVQLFGGQFADGRYTFGDDLEVWGSATFDEAPMLEASLIMLENARLTGASTPIADFDRIDVNDGSEIAFSVQTRANQTLRALGNGTIGDLLLGQGAELTGDGVISVGDLEMEAWTNVEGNVRVLSSAELTGGIATVGRFELADAGTIGFDIGAGADVEQLRGDTVVFEGGHVTVRFTDGMTLREGDEWRIVEAGSFHGSDFSWSTNADLTDTNLDLTLLQDGQRLTLRAVAVPEPSSLLVTCAALGVALLATRRSFSHAR